MKSEPESVVSAFACQLTMVGVLLAFSALAYRLYDVQVRSSSDLSDLGRRQSERIVRTAGERGRIVDRHGVVLADNRRTLSIVCDAAAFQKRSWSETADTLADAIDALARSLVMPAAIDRKAIERHLAQTLSRPLKVWDDVDEETLARFCERRHDFPGFFLQTTEERIYPYGRLASHLLGYVGHAEVETPMGEKRANFRERELRGREGLELYYDEFLRGVPGELRITVDARGFAFSEQVGVRPIRGPDLELTLDSSIQRVVERELAGECGACVVLDPRDGSVLALASAPDYDLSNFVPRLSSEDYRALCTNRDHPFLNRALGGAYAPGSTFKPVTALAALELGIPASVTYLCTGAFSDGGLDLRCARRWGHGELSLTQAIKVSCNPFFCNLACEVGTNRLLSAARELGLGEKTGIDFGGERSGILPDHGWKMRLYHEPWAWSDLPQMGIGQGMVLVTPLQMARLTGAIATGYLVRPRLKRDLPVERRALAVKPASLAVIREGMRQVVNEKDGSGVKGGAGVAVEVCGKTGTAEVGSGSSRRKNTWFIAYAPKDNPRVALALLVENGVSGGGTAAPKAANILKSIFGGT